MTLLQTARHNVMVMHILDSHMCNMTLPAFVTWLLVEHYGDWEGVFPTTSFNQGYHNLCLIHFGRELWGRKVHRYMPRNYEGPLPSFGQMHCLRSVSPLIQMEMNNSHKPEAFLEWNSQQTRLKLTLIKLVSQWAIAWDALHIEGRNLETSLLQKTKMGLGWRVVCASSHHFYHFEINDALVRPRTCLLQTATKWK